MGCRVIPRSQVEPLSADIMRAARYLRRKLVILWGWLRWHLWYKRHARESLALYEAMARNRSRRTH